MDKADGNDNHSQLKRIAFDPRDDRSYARLQLEIELARLVRRQEIAAVSYLPEVKQILLVFRDIAAAPSRAAAAPLRPVADPASRRAS